MKNRFDIDFFEFSFLVEACIPPRPIARAIFWDRVINEYYHLLTTDERQGLFKWINLNPSFKEGLKEGNEDCLVFQARFDPSNQYRVRVNNQGEEKIQDCFLYRDQYYTSNNSFIMKAFILEIL